MRQRRDVCKERLAVDDEGVYVHAIVAPGGLMGFLHADMEEDNGVGWGGIEGLLGVWEDGYTRSRVLV
jgi:hypothetical protein